MPSELVVTHRLFRYEFVLRTNRPVSQNSEKLERRLAMQTRPKGFHLQDPRLVGSVSGATFELRPFDSALWGLMVPSAKGYFVPSEAGSDAVVRVGPSPGSVTALSLVVAFAIAVIVWYEGITRDLLLALGPISLVLLGLLIVPPLVHGARLARMLRGILA